MRIPNLKIVGLFAATALFFVSPQANAQWDDAEFEILDIAENNSPSSINSYADVDIAAGKISQIWEQTQGASTALYCAIRQPDGTWSDAVSISTNILANESSVSTKNGKTYIAYLQNEGTGGSINIAILDGNAQLLSTDILVEDAAFPITKKGLQLAIDANDVAHLAWAMTDAEANNNRIYYTNTSDIGQLLGAVKFPISQMGEFFNPLDLIVTDEGAATIAYVGKGIGGTKPLQVAYNDGLNSSNITYNTLYGVDEDFVSDVRLAYKEGNLYYAIQGEEQFYWLKTQINETSTFLEPSVISNVGNGSISDHAVQSGVDYYATFIDENGVLQYAQNSSPEEWTTAPLLAQGVHQSGSLFFANENAFWAGISDGQAVLFGAPTLEADPNVGNVRLSIETSRIYPNPTANFLNVELEGNFSLEIFNVEGKQIFRDTQLQNAIQLDVSNWNSGIYILNVSKEGKSIRSEKLIVK